jgi:hypothetical protein
MVFVAGATAVYLVLVELIKRPFARSHLIAAYQPARSQA